MQIVTVGGGGSKNRGFTLIEILGVITLLSLISTILIIVVNKSLKETKETLYKSQLENIRSAASMWRTDNIERIPDDGYYTIILKKLIDDNYIDKNIENPKTKEPFDKNTVIRIGMKDIKVGDEQLLVVVNNGAGLYLSDNDEDRFIFRGYNPHNYIWLDENGDGKQVASELYRIISYETDGTIKVIREFKVNSIYWDSASYRTIKDDSLNTYCIGYEGCNVWGNQANTLYNLNFFNSNFYYEYYVNNLTKVRGMVGTVNENSYLNNYLNVDWLDNKVQKFTDLIISHNFYVGAYSYINNLDYLKELEEIKSYTWNGKIGLMSLIDFKDASVNPNCKGIYDLTIYSRQETGNNYCFSDNWLKNYYGWTINARANNTEKIWYLDSHESFFDAPANSILDVKPVFFLKPSINLIGEGTRDKPFMVVN